MAVVTNPFPRLRHRRKEQLHSPESEYKERGPENSPVAEKPTQCDDQSDVGHNFVGGKGPQYYTRRQPML